MTTLLCVTGILLVNILFYMRTIRYKYVSDDIISSQRPKETTWWKQLFWVLEGKLKYTPEVDHAITTILHSLVAVGIYLGFGTNLVSLSAALLFSFNPMNNQGAIWISARGYVLSALGMVWAMALPLWVGGLALLVATYSNAGFLMPLALVGSSHWPLLICAGLLWWYLLPTFKKNVVQKMEMETFVHDKVIHPKKLILGFRTFGFYLSRSIIPRPITFYHKELESIAGSKASGAYKLDILFWTGILSFIGMITYVCLVPWNTISLGLLWFCLGIAPFCNLYRMQQELADRYTYVANVGLMVVLASILIHWPVLMGLWLGAMALTTWQFIPAYKDDFWLIEYSRINEPNSWFAWHIAAMKRFEVASYQEALMFWVMAKIISPKEFKILFNIAAMLKMMKKDKESEEFLKEAEANIPLGQEQSANRMLEDFKANKIAIVV